MKKLCFLLALIIALIPCAGFSEAEHTIADRGAHPNCAACGGALTEWGQCTACFEWCACWTGYCSVSMCLPEKCDLHNGNCPLINGATGSDGSGETRAQFPSKQDILNSLGLFMIDDLSELTGCTVAEKDGLKIYGTTYPEDVVCHGSDIDRAKWLTAQGIMSDMDIDLDGDGVNEYMVIRWQEGDEYGVPNVYACIYEASEGGYVLAAEMPLPGNGLSETEVWLESHANKWYIVGDALNRGDGGWCLAQVMIYEYDGQRIQLLKSVGVDNYEGGVIVDANEDYAGTFACILTDYAAEDTAAGLPVEHIALDSDEPAINGYERLSGEMSAYGVDVQIESEGYDVSFSGARRILHICGRHDGNAGDADIAFGFLSSQEHYSGVVSQSDKGALDFFGTDPASPETPDDDIDGEYFIADSDTRLLTREELSVYTKEELGFIRNEILARYGYPFKKETYREYFESKSWYVRNEGFVYNMLSEIEMKNVELIKSME